MGRRLPPGEAERRAKERKRQQWAKMRSGEAYKSFDPNDGIGYGSEAQWQQTAEARANGRLPKAAPRVNADLVLLGLEKAPTDRRSLDLAYRKATLKSHPDAAGGSHAAFLALTEAYERLKLRVR